VTAQLGNAESQYLAARDKHWDLEYAMPLYREAAEQGHAGAL